MKKILNKKSALHSDVSYITGDVYISQIKGGKVRENIHFKAGGRVHFRYAISCFRKKKNSNTSICKSFGRIRHRFLRICDDIRLENAISNYKKKKKKGKNLI